MGVSTEIITMYGIKIDYDEDMVELLECSQHCAEFDIVTDGMGGEYIAIGKILYNSGDFRYNFRGATGDVRVNIEELDAIEKTSKEALMKEYPQLIPILYSKKFSIMCFGHYS